MNKSVSAGCHRPRVPSSLSPRATPYWRADKHNDGYADPRLRANTASRIGARDVLARQRCGLSVSDTMADWFLRADAGAGPGVALSVVHGFRPVAQSQLGRDR